MTTKSLIHTNPSTKETRWCVANVESELTVAQYIAVVDLGFRDDPTHQPANFKWVEEFEGVSMLTHDYKDGIFVSKSSTLPVQ
jgi:hypothetical protein